MFTLGIAEEKVVRSAISPIHVQWGLNPIRIGTNGMSRNQLSYDKTFVPFINNLIQCGFSYL